MISRSLETLSIRMEKADRNARLVADYLRDHAKVAKVHYLAHHEEASSAGRVFARQGTESLASLPASMTHSGVPAGIRQKIGVLDSTIRLSIGIEHPSDLIADIAQALNEV
jgi:methionine-gamma-lyase